jgi:isopenicillin N synthase-like dioxygenase
MTPAADGIPVLDLGPWRRGEAGAHDRLAQELRRACLEVGFFFIAGHGVDQALVDAAFAQTEAFHAQPDAAKAALAINQHNIGYMASRASMQRSSTVHKATKPNLVASFFMKRERSPDAPEVVAGLPLRGLNQWPRHLPDFRPVMLAYMTAMETLGLSMLPLYARSLDLAEDHFAPFFAQPSITLRISSYPPQDAFDGEEFGTGPHTDAGFMTLLAQAQVPGLEILHRDGSWRQAPVLPGCFLVNIGQMLTRWTNDRYPSTPHRVINLSGRQRYSMPFFFDPDFEAVIACLPTCRDAGQPALHDPIRYLDHILAFTGRNFDHNRKPAA